MDELELLSRIERHLSAIRACVNVLTVVIILTLVILFLVL